MMRKMCITAMLGILLATPSVAKGSEDKTVLASYYKYGTKTANGSKYNPEGLTAAHRNLPFGTKIKVTNVNNDKSVIVTVTDRGPFIKSRSLDLSLGAARKLEMLKSGVSRVKMEIIES